MKKMKYLKTFESFTPDEKINEELEYVKTLKNLAIGAALILNLNQANSQVVAPRDSGYQNIYNTVKTEITNSPIEYSYMTTTQLFKEYKKDILDFMKIESAKEIGDSSNSIKKVEIKNEFLEKAYTMVATSKRDGNYVSIAISGHENGDITIGIKKLDDDNIKLQVKSEGRIFETELNKNKAQYSQCLDLLNKWGS